MPYRTLALPIPDKPSPEPQGATGPDIKIVISPPNPVAQPVAASFPLAVIKAMSDEEKIALFS